MTSAVVIAAGVAAAGAVAGSAIAGSEESSAVTGAANTAAGEQQNALNQQATLAAPYTGIGQAAIPQYEALLGLTGPSTGASSVAGVSPTGQTVTAAGAPTNTSTLAALQNTPGYQFTLSQGLQGVTNQATASGMLNSGNTLEALDRYGSGLADTTYQQALTNSQNAVGIGQAAAAGQAANIGTAATNEGNIAVGEGQSLANVDANTLAGIEQGLGSATGAASTAYTLQGLTNPSAGLTQQSLASGVDYIQPGSL